MRNLLKDLGWDRASQVQIMTDASAAIGIASRRGTGKVRHIEVNQLWLQDKVMRNDIELAKVRTDQNPADALTKYVDWDAINKHMGYVAMRYESGRHPDMPIVAAQEEWDCETYED